MSAILLLEQTLNSLQFGLMLFLLAAGLTLVFGIMDMINLAHGSLYMVGAYLMATFAEATGSFYNGDDMAKAAEAPDCFFTTFPGLLTPRDSLNAEYGMSVLGSIVRRDGLRRPMA